MYTQGVWIHTYNYFSAIFPHLSVHRTSIPLLPSKLTPPVPKLHLLLPCLIYQLLITTHQTTYPLLPTILTQHAYYTY